MSAPTARRPAVVGLLSRISLFNCFDRREREALAPLFAERSYRKGDVICREGEAGEEFFVIVSGELEVWGGGEPSRVINRLGPGDFLGEITLLAGGKRTATVTAARSAKLLALDRQAFNRFFAHNPKVLEYLSQALCKRLVETSHETGAARKCVAVSVVGRPGVKGKSLIAAVLGELIGRMSGHGTLLIRAQSSARGPQARACSLPLAELCQNPRRAIDDGLAEAGAESPGVALAVPPEVGELRLVEALTALLDALPGRFRYLIFDPGNSAGPLARACRQVSDVVVELVEGARNARLGSQRSPQSTLRVVNLHGRRAAPVPVNHCEPFLIPEDRSLRHLNLAAQVRYLRDNPWSAASPPLHRLARKILGGTVGLALGGGAAFGLAHIGVLRVLEDNAVPVDLLAGTSFGSIVALGYAASLRWRRARRRGDRHVV